MHNCYYYLTSPNHLYYVTHLHELCQDIRSPGFETFPKCSSLYTKIKQTVQKLRYVYNSVCCVTYSPEYL